MRATTRIPIPSRLRPAIEALTPRVVARACVFAVIIAFVSLIDGNVLDGTAADAWASVISILAAPHLLERIGRGVAVLLPGTLLLEIVLAVRSGMHEAGRVHDSFAAPEDDERPIAHAEPLGPLTLVLLPDGAISVLPGVQAAGPNGCPVAVLGPGDSWAGVAQSEWAEHLFATLSRRDVRRLERRIGTNGREGLA